MNIKLKLAITIIVEDTAQLFEDYYNCLDKGYDKHGMNSHSRHFTVAASAWHVNVRSHPRYLQQQLANGDPNAESSFPDPY